VGESEVKMINYDDICALVVSYNRLEMLEECLTSIRKHHPMIDICVIFQGYFLDEAIQITKKYNIKHVVFYNRGIGVVAARKAGYSFLIAEKKYSYILDMDDDSKIGKNFLKVTYENIEKYNNVGIISGPYQFGVSLAKRADKQIIRSNCPFACKLIRIEFLENFIDKILDREMQICDDLELTFRMFLEGHECVVVYGATFYHNIHKAKNKPGGISRKNYRQLERDSRLYLQKKYGKHLITVCSNNAFRYIDNLIKLGYVQKELQLTK